MSSMWFSQNTGIIIGVMLGSLIGILGGLWGAITGIFARQGRFKRFILSYAIILIAIGIITLCSGIVALLSKQPYYVWYPLILAGFITTVHLVPGFILVKKVYSSIENKPSNDISQ